MRPRRILLRVSVVVAAALLPLGLMSPAHAAPKPKVTVSQSGSSFAPGKFVTFKGKVSRKSQGAKIRLQRHEGGKWVNIASGKVSKSRKFSLTSRATVGKYKYRVHVTGNKKIASAVSRTMSVSGAFHRSVHPAMVNETFRLSAQLPNRVTRPVWVERKVGNSWEQIALVNSSSVGVVSTSMAFATNTVVRFNAPAATVGSVSYPAWSSSGTTITVVEWDRNAANKILADINKLRKAKKKKALKLHIHNSTVAYNWSKHMHDAEHWGHNPRYSKQISPKWKRAGENIAAGQTTSTVVTAWKNSSGHYKNMVGDYTHLGVGVFSGTDGYKRYFTTVHAKY